MARLPWLLVVLGAAALAAQAPEQAAWQDDECQAAEGEEGCTVELLQRRAVKVAVDTAVTSGSTRRRRGGSGGSAEGAGQPAVAAGSGTDLTPTPAELKTLAAVIQRLWSIDAPYRLDPGTGYQMDVQSPAQSLQSKGDSSPRPLFKYVNEAKFRQMPCSRTFLALLDNYERDSEVREVVSTAEQSEVTAFMKELMATPHMKYAYNVLTAWSSFKGDYNAFAKHVESIWFTTYSMSRNGPKVSSGFEHVFVGEEKYDKKSRKQTITGLHNWIQFWNEEKAKRIDYLGYVGKANANSHLLSARFEWKDDDPERETKSVSTMLVGSSVPFEMAMLTCAFAGFNGQAQVGGIYFGNEGPARIKTFSWKAPEGTVVRTGFIEA